MPQTLDLTADEVRSKTDRVVLRQVFGTWIASERSKLLISVHDTRLTRDCIKRWRNKRKAIAELEGRLRRRTSISKAHKQWSRINTSVL
jgi:hypothetical protein